MIMNTDTVMFEAAASDFPFVAELPKREKSKVVQLWDAIQDMRRIYETEGLLIPQPLAAKLLGLSRQRVHQLGNEGRLMVVTVNDHPFVTENSVLAYAKSERKAGRPLGVLDSKDSAAKVGFKLAVDAAKEMRRK